MSNTEELLLKVSGDSAGGQQAVTQLVDAFKGLGLHGDNVGEQLKHAFENPQGAVEGLAGSLGSMIGIAAGTAAALTAVGVAAFELAEKAAAVGGNLNDMAEKTGLSVPVLSRLSLAAQVAGTDLSQLTSAVFMLEKGMGEGSDKVETGLRRIGLSTEELRAAGPDQYLILIAQNLMHLEDPTARAATVMELFGRQGREIIPTLMKLNAALEITADIQPWTDEQAAEAEHFEMQMKSLKIHIEALAVAFGRDLIGPISDFVGWMTSAWETTNQYFDLSGGFLPMLHSMAEAWRTVAAAVEVLRGTSEKLPSTLIALGASAESTAEKLKKLKDAAFDAAHTPDKDVTAWKDAIGGMALKVPTLTDALAIEKSVSKDLTEEVTKHIKALEKVETIHLDLPMLLKHTELALTQLGGVVKDNTAHLDAQAAIFEDVRSRIVGTFVDIDTLAGKTESADAISQRWRDTLHQVRREIDEAAAAQSRLGQTLDRTFEEMPRLLEQALTGGGGLSGAVKAIGSNFGRNLGTSLMTSWQQHAQDQTGEALAGFAGKFASMLPMVGSMIGPAIGALTKWITGMFGPSQAELEGRKVEAAFEQQFGSFQKMLDAVGAAYQATGRTAQMAQADVKALMDAEKLGGQAATEAANKIKQAFTEQTQDAADLTAAVQRYGFSLAELGPTMQKQKLDEQAKQLVNDWRVLVASGMDVVTVDEHMAKSVQDYLDTARTTGQEVPIAMQPIIEKMIEEGRLTDENGQKVTEMGALHLTWTETMTQGFDRVVGKLNDLLVAIGVKLPTVVSGAVATTVRSADEMVGKWHEVGEAVDAVNFGHSPGGLKEIPLLLGKANAALAITATFAGSAFGGIESDILGVMTATDGFGRSLDDAQAKLMALNLARAKGATGTTAADIIAANAAAAGNLSGDAIGRSLDTPGGNVLGPGGFKDTVIRPSDLIGPDQVHQLVVAAYQAHFGGTPTDAQLQALAAAAGYTQGTSVSRGWVVNFLNSQSALDAVANGGTFRMGAAAHGIYADRATPAIFGEGGEPELGGPVSFMSKALEGAIARLEGVHGAGRSMAFSSMAAPIASIVFEKGAVDFSGSIVRDRAMMQELVQEFGDVLVDKLRLGRQIGRRVS